MTTRNVIMYSFLCFAIATVSANYALTRSSIEQVHVFFRHGDRAPDRKDFWPTDPYLNYSFSPGGVGQLSNEGKRRAYQLGEYLRQKYDSFLGDIYSPSQVSVFTTNFDRTKMSAQLVLAGLFPPTPVQQWNPHLSWIPIPYSYWPKEYDKLVQRPNDVCPKYLDELEAAFQTPEALEYLKKYSQLFSYLEKYTGKTVASMKDVFNIYQNLVAEANFNLTLPEWSSAVFPEPMATVAGLQCHFENSNDVLKKLNGGRMVKMIIENSDQKIRKQARDEKKLIVVSGHENNVLNVLAALNVFKPHVPKYSSAVIVEFHRISASKKYGFKILYIDQISSEAQILTIPECSALCPYENFVRLTKDVIPKNFDKECER